MDISTNTKEHQTALFQSMVNRATTVRLARVSTAPVLAVWDTASFMRRLLRLVFGDSTLWGLVQSNVTSQPDGIGIAANHIVVTRGEVTHTVLYESIPGLREAALAEVFKILKQIKTPASDSDIVLYRLLFVTGLEASQQITGTELNVYRNKIAAKTTNTVLEAVQQKADGFSYGVKQYVVAHDILNVDNKKAIKVTGVGAGLLAKDIVLTFDGLGRCENGVLTELSYSSGDLQLALAALCLHGNVSLVF